MKSRCGHGPVMALLARKASRLFVALALVALGTRSAEAQGPASREYGLKAAYLYNFMKFVSWPSEALDGSPEHIVVCVHGEDPFVDNLDKIDGKPVGQRSVVVHRCEDLLDLSRCHVLFISSRNAVPLDQVLNEAATAGVLTVSDIEDFIDLGGMIGFKVTRNRLRFEINLTAAERAGLRLRSRLLRLAVDVR